MFLSLLFIAVSWY